MNLVGRTAILALVEKASGYPPWVSGIFDEHEF
jgi:hypothetical protein